MEKTTIDSLKVLHQYLPMIMDRIYASPQLALAAAANPLHAMEELGYRITPEARAEIEHHIRFRPETAQRLAQLRDQIFQIAKRQFDLDAPDLHRVLCEELQISLEQAGQSEDVLQAAPLEESGHGPLEKLRGTHPIMELLLEYRCLEATSPRLADLALYREIRNGNRPAAKNRAHHALPKLPD